MFGNLAVAHRGILPGLSSSMTLEGQVFLIEFCLLLLTCIGVTPGLGWSDPILVTDSANTQRRIQFLNIDALGRFHLIWAGYNDQHRIAYKMFDIDGTVLFPETMISGDVNSVYLRETVMGDSLFVFWRESSPIYYAIRSLADGSEITPATYLFTTSTSYPFIRTSPDSLGRLHVMYNIGPDVHYAVWTPAPGSGFITERDWKIEGAYAGGVLLVDGNRVHCVVQDFDSFTYDYLQYDLDGNTVVPIRDFTADDLIACGRYPELNVDSSGNLMVLESTGRSGQDYRFVLWKLSKDTGDTMIDEKVIVIGIPPVMAIGTSFILRALPGSEEFYLCWTIGQNYAINKVFNLVMDENGNVIVDWHIGYDYSDEDPEDIDAVDGVVDEFGNLYLIFNQGETEPVLGGYPTFGWFDYDFVSTLKENAPVEPPCVISFSSNPVRASVTVYASSEAEVLRVFDIAGREVSSIPVSEGTGVWHGTDFSGNRLPVGVYSVVENSSVQSRITLLD